MLVIDSFAFTDKGGRDHNEDSVLERRLEGGMVFVAADGLGGHSHGEVASGCITEHFSEADLDPQTEPAEWLRRELEAANNRLLALKKKRHSGMKSTAAVLLIAGKKACWTHVGDTRIYYLHDDSVFSVTEDHSVAFKKFLVGEITYDQIGMDEDQSSLLRSVGSEDRFIPESGSSDIKAGDAFLLCTDGLWKYVLRSEVLIDLLKSESAREWAENLLLRYMERAEKGCDNVSLITVMIK